MFEKYPRVLDSLLKDRNTDQNILWASDDYAQLGNAYSSHCEIRTALIVGRNRSIIKPRFFKSDELQLSRTKIKAEVYTPSWLCNIQNNIIDDAWFNKRNLFNTPRRHRWITHRAHIAFPNSSDKNWKHYVDERRMEYACGEAPYLVSPYDATTGIKIAPLRRIGLLDRKMRIIHENVTTEAEWLKWAERAFQSIYGFEFQGDSLLLARENLLTTYIDYTNIFLRRSPKEQELLNIATIISWNLWQMDGLTGTIPYQQKSLAEEQIELFSKQKTSKSNMCYIKDWRTKKIESYENLLV